MSVGHPPEIVEAIIAHYGKTRAADVAAQFGLPSRSAVVAIWYRARKAGVIEKVLPQPKDVAETPAQIRKKAVAASARKHDPEPEKRVAKPASGDECSFMGLEYWSCRWIVAGRGFHATYCGAPKDGARPYCAAHCGLAYVPFR